MAKSLGGGFPIAAFWAREAVHGVRLCDLLGPGMHATTYGGTPLGCAVALKVFEVIEREGLAAHVRELGDWIKSEFQRLVETYPSVVKSARGMGFMLGLEFQPREQIPALASGDKAVSTAVVNRLQEAGVLTIPSGTQIIRLLPSLNLTRPQAEEGIAAIEAVVRGLVSR